ncbi:hypothetical protein NM3139_1283 [Neisseria meningitidis NM3139]|nr:hypothetical protein NM3139_1283 [Neisseria meningitidis NM3139]EQD09847.1 hypothetical protein NM003_1225 [Neisseria meningitidis NM003]
MFGKEAFCNHTVDGAGNIQISSNNINDIADYPAAEYHVISHDAERAEQPIQPTSFQILAMGLPFIGPPNASSAFTPLRRPMTFSTKIIGMPITSIAIQNKNTYAPPPFSPTKYGKRHVAPKPTVAPAMVRI